MHKLTIDDLTTAREHLLEAINCLTDAETGEPDYGYRRDIRDVQAELQDALESLNTLLPESV